MARPSRAIDLVGKRFGRWVVLERGENDSSRTARWLCRCDCGTERIVLGVTLRSGLSSSCGCKDGIKKDDLIGKRFGKLVVLGRDIDSDDVGWLCICDCGTEKTINGYSLLSGHTQSCGCLALTKATTHGKSYDPEYRSWGNAKYRCHNPDSECYESYGGRGIHMCQHWRESFDNFYVDMGPRPGKEYSLDRIDNDKNYSCGKCDECVDNGWSANCRWATRKEQMNNRRVSKKYKAK